MTKSAISFDSNESVPAFLKGEGEMFRLVRSFDWKNSSIGVISNWPPELVSIVGMILHSKFPMFLWWGPDLIQFYNDQYRQILGDNGKHPLALGQRGQDCWPEIWDTIFPMIGQVLSGGEGVWSEDRLVPIFRNGKIENVYWTFGYSPVYSAGEKIEGVLVNCLETTSKIKEKEILDSQNKLLNKRFGQLNQLFEQTPSFMAILEGPNHVFKFCNNAYYDLVGHRDIIGKNLLDAIPEMGDQVYLKMLDSVLADGKPISGNSVPVLLQKLPDDPPHLRYVDFTYHPLLNTDQSIAGIIVEGHDVTAQKNAESELHEASHRKDDFLATLAHELRNPLFPIKHAAAISQSSDVTESELKWSHKVIERQAEHMGRLLDDLLDVSRISASKLVLRKEILPVNRSLIGAVEAISPLIETRGHRITIEGTAEECFIDADPVRFEQILSNLLNNAAKYTNSGGFIHVQAILEPLHVKIIIKDNGTGISPDLLPHLFEMFSQGAGVSDRSDGGLGIGLSLVKGLVLLHGAFIQAHSKGIGCGSQFIITWPLANTLQKLDSPLEHLDNGSGVLHEIQRILIVDDNRDGADLLSALFKRELHDVRTAYNGLDALQLAGEFHPQFVLLDIGLPDIDGYEVARRLRAMDIWPPTVLVAVTGWGQAQDKLLAQSAGFDYHLVKPVGFEVIRSLLYAASRETGHKTDQNVV